MFYFLSKFYNSSFFFQRRIVMGHESFIFIIYFFTFVGDMMCQVLSYSVKTMERKNFLEGSLCRIVQDPIKISVDIFSLLSPYFFSTIIRYFTYTRNISLHFSSSARIIMEWPFFKKRICHSPSSCAYFHSLLSR